MLNGEVGFVRVWYDETRIFAVYPGFRDDGVERLNSQLRLPREHAGHLWPVPAREHAQRPFHGLVYPGHP